LFSLFPLRKFPFSARVDVERPYGELSNSSVKTKPKKPNAPAVTRECRRLGFAALVDQALTWVQ
jgi:hypothetical protein